MLKKVARIKPLGWSRLNASVSSDRRRVSFRSGSILSISRAVLATLCCFAVQSAVAGAVDVRQDHPDRYVVQQGDTLWGIANRFLNNPAQWPEIWRGNRRIANPHLIYPGDEIVFSVANGSPQLEVGTPSDIRLSPSIRSTPLEQAIPAIPMEAIRQFLTRPRVVTEDEQSAAPYVVAFAREHVVGGAGDRIYVRSVPEGTASAFNVFRSGKPYKDAETGEVLGYEALFIADTRLEAAGDPASLLLIRSEREVRLGDRLLPVEEEKITTAFYPHSPQETFKGHIISVLGGVSEIGQYQVVVLDRGLRDGLENGHVLDIFRRGGSVRDIVGSGGRERVELPNEKAGTLMVFRCFERVSYGLVMSANRALHVADIVLPP